MENKFEKMDQWMMKASREMREQRIPRKELDAFHEGVMKKIAASSAPAWGLPFPGLMMAAALALAVIGGTVFYLHQVPVGQPEEKPVKAEVRRITEPVAPSPAFQEPMQPMTQPITVPVTAAPQIQKPVQAVQAIPPAVSPAATVVKDEDLLEEIEALKELGVWNEEDEEEAGIPVEAAFAELENYMGDNQSPVAIPASAS